jgi:hypothetical protein
MIKMKITTSIVTIMALTILFACGGKTERAEQGQTNIESSSEHSNHSKKVKHQGEKYNASLDYSGEKSESLIAYYKLKDALVNSDIDAASSAGKKLAESIAEEKLLVDKDAVEIVRKSNELTEIRSVFEQISVDMYKNLQDGTIPSSQILYKQYCPMAFENKGAYWLSNMKEVYNPYFGDQMLHCGRIEETIN